MPILLLRSFTSLLSKMTKKVNSFNTKIRDAIPRRYLLQQNIIGEVLNIDTSNAEKAFLLVQDLLDKYLNRSCYIFSESGFFSQNSAFKSQF